MRIYLVTLVLVLLMFSTALNPQRSTSAESQVNCSAISLEELLHCDVPSDPSLTYIRGLQVGRPANYHCYREPSLVLNKQDGSKAVYPITSATWTYNADKTRILTTFVGSGNPGAVFLLRSTTSFSPLAGKITIGGTQEIRFNTCGNQTTSAYYWTGSGQHPLEGFCCPLSGQPRGCPSVGYNP